MTVRASRSFDVDVPIEQAWELLSDPRKRAEAISVVERFELHDDTGTDATWHVSLPIPLVDRTVRVRTRELEREEPRYVKFEGHSRLLDVVGEHELSSIPGGTRVENRFRVDSNVPGVERFFRRHLGTELENIRTALARHLDDPDIE